MKFLLPILAAATIAAPNQSSDDVLMRAMTDELQRSTNQLQLEHHEKPYYVSYKVDDYKSVTMAASFGALEYEHPYHIRYAIVDVHVGNYTMDSGNMGVTSFSFDDFRESTSFPLADNYDAIRHRLWLLTDSDYKHAVRDLEKKKASAQQKTTKDRPNDWSREPATVMIEPPLELHCDKTKWRQAVKELSSVFKEYPRIAASTVTFSSSVGTRYFVNNEGSKIRTPSSATEVNIEASAQGSDGLRIRAGLEFHERAEEKLPDLDSLKAQIKKLAQQLTDSVDGKEFEFYQGPVLFEKRAAALFFFKALAPMLVAERQKEAEHPKENYIQDRIGRRILPAFFNVEDDPALKDSEGKGVRDESGVDDQGVPTKNVILVEKGILKTLLAGRIPVRRIKESTGHTSRSGSPRTTNLIVQATQTMNPDALRAKLLELGKEEGLDYVLVVQKTGTLETKGDHGFVVYGDPFREKDAVELPAATVLKRIYVSDGHEEILRPGKFGSATIRILRDIVAAGDDAQLYPLNVGQTITTPSIIVNQVEMHRSQADVEKAPVLPHPYFEQKLEEEKSSYKNDKNP